MMRALLLLFVLCGCAPMPGNNLFEGVRRPANLGDVVVTETIDLFETSIHCNYSLPWHVVVLNCLLNACVVPACAEVLGDSDGIIRACNIYLSFDVDNLRQHELRHCMGYSDTLY